MYRGLLQPHKQLVKRVSVVSHTSKENNYKLSSDTSHWRRNRLQRQSSTTSVISDYCTSSISSCESNTAALPQQNRRVAFSINSELTIHEHAREESESDNIFEDCTVITNTELVNEMETDFNKDDPVFDTEI